MVTSCTTPNSHSARLMPSLTIQMPPTMPPITIGHSPAFLAMMPISVLPAHVEIKGVASAVASESPSLEEDEGQHQQRRSGCRDGRRTPEGLDHRGAQVARLLPIAISGSPDHHRHHHPWHP